jgi:hypothetical protein
MSSAVRHQALHVRSAPTEAHSEAGTGLLASSTFWVGGAASVGIWTLVAFALSRLF